MKRFNEQYKQHHRLKQSEKDEIERRIEDALSVVEGESNKKKIWSEYLLWPSARSPTTLTKYIRWDTQLCGKTIRGGVMGKIMAVVENYRLEGELSIKNAIMGALQLVHDEEKSGLFRDLITKWMYPPVYAGSASRYLGMWLLLSAIIYELEQHNDQTATMYMIILVTRYPLFYCGWKGLIELKMKEGKVSNVRKLFGIGTSVIGWNSDFWKAWVQFERHYGSDQTIKRVAKRAESYGIKL
eukprot:TRINITY_DN10521_c0_g1_i1.p1 TRINITY_DN10521_c0_g1~~TRINITY_DN10521_c0_g1_i1.p1  ORF type:complete len:241 (-),score=47.18 TRINITY_DN10521_c0_g1_i1:48-770(-)